MRSREENKNRIVEVRGSLLTANSSFLRVLLRRLYAVASIADLSGEELEDFADLLVELNGGEAGGVYGSSDPEPLPPLPSTPPDALSTQVGGNHYKAFPIQPAEFATKNNLSFLEGCAIKRLCRHSRGGKGIEDLRKAVHEIQMQAELQYGEKL